MTVVEARAHSLRVKPEKGLSTDGVRLARAAAAALGGAYHAYYTATARRCRETLEAMGFPTYAELEAFGPLPDDLDRFEAELYARQCSTGCRYMNGYLEIPAARAILQDHGRLVVKELRKIARHVAPGGRALVISHPETIELLWMAARPEFAPGFPGGELKPLEGVAVDVEDDQVRSVQVLRLPAELGAPAGA